jgi:hypothetical protein
MAGFALGEDLFARGGVASGEGLAGGSGESDARNERQQGNRLHPCSFPLPRRPDMRDRPIL